VDGALDVSSIVTATIGAVFAVWAVNMFRRGSARV
jgi:uncharacterized membrane protein YeaQ/YmgE (transglycosylase-associated protein family)